MKMKKKKRKEKVKERENLMWGLNVILGFPTAVFMKNMTFVCDALYADIEVPRFQINLLPRHSLTRIH